MKNITKIGIGMMIAFMLICVLVPTNVYATVDGKVTESFSSISEVTAVATVTFSGEDASEYRALIDYISGDADGDVASSEVEEFEDYLEEDSEEEECDYTLDGNRGTYTNNIYSIAGATGGIDSTESLTIEAQTKITFGSVDKELDSHTFKIFMSEDETVMDYKLTVPSGYKIETVKGVTNPVKSNGDRTVEGKVAAENIEITIIKAKEDTDSDDSPGFELIGVALAAGLCIAVVGWRKRNL